ncbi:hypothetical protein CJU90_4842 [Yarrowia sp. C11]|nr:hypothetical protein CJU90_4842 [Yarrowia sp. C11]KAG5364659.1 hypothetical protein CKK34_3474 [Yarrowia sp. E02]
MDNLKSLGKGLPPTAVDASLTLEFRNAANAVTKLYKVANEKTQMARHEGYKQCLSDVLGFLQQHQQRHVDGLRRESEGESGDLAHELWKWVTKQEERLDEDDTVTSLGANTNTNAATSTNTNTNTNTNANATSASVPTTTNANTNTNTNASTSASTTHDNEIRMGFTPFSFSQDLVYPGYAAVKRKGHAHGHVYHCDEDSEEDEGSKRMRIV